MQGKFSELFMKINILESKNQLSRLLRRAQAGEDVIIANRGVPVARLVPISAQDAAAGGDVLVWLQQHPLPAALRRSHAEIEAEIGRERAAWD